MQMIEDKGLLEESQGAMVVQLSAEELPPCLITKKDGTTLYATRDLAAASLSQGKLSFHRVLICCWP